VPGAARARYVHAVVATRANLLLLKKFEIKILSFYLVSSSNYCSLRFAISPQLVARSCKRKSEFVRTEGAIVDQHRERREQEMKIVTAAALAAGATYMQWLRDSMR
jgi:hypothetical protein